MLVIVCALKQNKKKILKKKGYFAKKVSSDISYNLTYLTLEYERNRIFHPCRENLILSDFYSQALLSTNEECFLLCCIGFRFNLVVE